MWFFVVTLLVLSIPGSLLAFNGANCKKELYHPITKRMGSTPWTWMTISTLAPTSTSQFVSSTGSCSSTALKIESQKLEYLANNLIFMQRDSARGGGEYLSAYASMLDCNAVAVSYLGIVVKDNYTKVFGEDINKEVGGVYKAVESLIQEDPILKRGCSRKT